ncbi:Transcription and mRNA export factor eny2 [Paramecium bursaria]
MRSNQRIDTFKSGTIQSDRSIKTIDRPKSPDRMQLLFEALQESGQQIKLEEYLRQKFIDVGWKDELKNQVKNYIKQQKGMKQYTRTELQRECDKIVEETVPNKLREDLTNRLTQLVTSEEFSLAIETKVDKYKNENDRRKSQFQ